MSSKKHSFGVRRAEYFDVRDCLDQKEFQVAPELKKNLEDLDLIYRTLCGILYNFVPTSGHPGGSISSVPCPR